MATMRDRKTVEASHESPHPVPLPLGGGEGGPAVAGSSEGWFMPMHAQKRKEATHNQGGETPSSSSFYPLEIRARRSLAPPFTVPMRCRFLEAFRAPRAPVRGV